MGNKLKKNGDTYKGRSGTYILTNDEFTSLEGKYNLYKIIVIGMELEYIGSFTFKKLAIELINKLEDKYLNSKEYLDIVLESGLISQEEYEEKINTEKN